MLSKRLMPLIVGFAALAGCAGGPQEKTVKSTAAAGEQVFTDADLAIAAKQEEKAFAMLKAASAAHPVDKRPWVKMAQIRFNAGNYGEAITHAKEALERDADDTVAHSIVAVSGLRVASKALADLTRKNHLSGDVKSEAQDLAKLLRTTLGEPILGNKGDGLKSTATRTKPSTPPSSPPASSTTKSASNSNDKDPFSGLK